MIRVYLLVVLLAALGGCEDHPHDEALHETESGPSEAFTTFGEATELFIELPALVAGESIEPAAHVTLLESYRPLAAGKVVIELSGGEGPTERFVADGPASPGIFRPVMKPAHAGRRELTVKIESGAMSEHHALGAVEVHATREAVPRGAQAQEGGIAFSKEQQWKLPFQVHEVGKRALRPSVEAYGTLVPRAGGAVDVTAPIAGRLDVHASFPHVGLEARVGAVLTRLVPRLEMQADPAALEAAVVEARIALDRAVRDRKRLAELSADGSVAEKRLLDAQTAERHAKSQLGAAQRRLAQARRFASGDPSGGTSGMEVIAPIAGTVVSVPSTPGSVVEAGQLLFRIIDLDRLWLEVHVAEAHASLLTNPRGVWFRVEGIDGVVDVGPEAIVGAGGEVDPHTRTVSLLVAIDNPEERLRVGMFAEVHVIEADPREALAVPVSAIVQSGALPYAYVLLEGERFERRSLRLGVRDGDWVAVEQGLEAGDRVVSQGGYAVHLAAAGGSVPDHGHAH